MARIEMAGLPDDVVAFVEEALGERVVGFANQNGGFSQGCAARVQGDFGARLFVKAIGRAGFEGTFSLYERELKVLSLLPQGVPVPRLVASYVSDSWIALAIEDVDGRFPSGVQDMYSVLDAVLMLPTADGVVGLRDAQDDLGAAFARFADVTTSFCAMTPWAIENLAQLEEVTSGAVEAVQGNDLVHNDLRTDNVLIDSGGKAWLVDWPWAVRGAKWFDALLFVLTFSLEHEDVDPEEVLRSHQLFAGVSAQDVDAVLCGFAGYYVWAAEQLADEVPQSLRTFQKDCAHALFAWLERRWRAL